jgi:hypothetical protein
MYRYGHQSQTYLHSDVWHSINHFLYLNPQIKRVFGSI